MGKTSLITCAQAGMPRKGKSGFEIHMRVLTVFRIEARTIARGKPTELAADRATLRWPPIIAVPETAVAGRLQSRTFLTCDRVTENSAPLRFP
jgi:hypothetical protein